MTITLYLTDIYQFNYSYGKLIQHPDGSYMSVIQHNEIIITREDLIDNYKITIPDYTYQDLENLNNRWDKILTRQLKNINLYFLENPEEKITEEEDIIFMAHIDTITPIYY